MGQGHLKEQVHEQARSQEYGQFQADLQEQGHQQALLQEKGPNNAGSPTEAGP